MEEALTIKDTLSLWAGAIWWTLIGIALVKTYYFPRTTTDWSWGYWIKNNIKDVVLGILITLVVVKLGETSILLLEATGVSFDTAKEVFEKVGRNPVDLSLVIAIFVQWRLQVHKEKKKNAGK